LRRDCGDRSFRVVNEGYGSSISNVLLMEKGKELTNEKPSTQAVMCSCSRYPADLLKKPVKDWESRNGSGIQVMLASKRQSARR